MITQWIEPILQWTGLSLGSLLLLLILLVIIIKD